MLPVGELLERLLHRYKCASLLSTPDPLWVRRYDLARSRRTRVDHLPSRRLLKQGRHSPGLRTHSQCTRRIADTATPTPAYRHLIGHVPRREYLLMWMHLLRPSVYPPATA